MAIGINKANSSHPLCNGTLPTAGFCEAGQETPLDEYKKYADWVPFFYAPPQYHFCRAFDEWYYRSCVPAMQSAREDIRDIAQKNGRAASKREITDQLSGTFNRTEGACAGVDPGILRETANRCDAIVKIHNKNRIITGLGALIIIKGLFTVHAIRHTTKSWNEMWAVGKKVWNEAKAARARRGVWAAARRLIKGIGQVWNAREGGFREQVTDINIFFAKLLEFAEPQQKLDAVAKWNEIKRQKSLSAEEKFERFKEVIRNNFGRDLLGMIDELGTGIVKEFIFQSGRIERLGQLIGTGRNGDIQSLTDKISAPIERAHKTLSLFRSNAGLFYNSDDVISRLDTLTDLTNDFLWILGDMNISIEGGYDLRDSEIVKENLRRHDFHRLDSIVMLAEQLAKKMGYVVQIGDVPDVRFQDMGDILDIYSIVKLAIESFARLEFLHAGPQRRAGEVFAENITASVEGNVIRLKISGGFDIPSHIQQGIYNVARDHDWTVIFKDGAVVFDIPQWEGSKGTTPAGTSPGRAPAGGGTPTSGSAPTGGSAPMGGSVPVGGDAPAVSAVPAVSTTPAVSAVPSASGVTSAPLGGYEADRSAAPLSAGARAMLNAEGQAGGGVHPSAQVPAASGAGAVFTPAPVLVVP